ncbi:MAG: carbonic anhydrase [Methylophilaceae bacterium]|nr:MAG: carbonic anhydrase [Methylophilaceae bacterium]
MNKTIIMSLLLAAGFSTGCMQDAPTTVNSVLSKNDRAAMTPDDVLQYLKEGNERFVAGTITSRDHSAQVRYASKGQYPKALVLSCLDSRIPVEDVFDLGIGDLFVARVAGNFENIDILGSMEFAGIHDNGDGVKVIVVMGHGSCGAIKHAVDHTQLGNVTAMLANIKPAIDAHASYQGDKTSKNSEFVQLVTESNVNITINDIRERSSVLKDLEQRGKIKIVGALYDMDTGVVTFQE